MRAEEDTKNSEPKVFTKIRKEFGKWKHHLDDRAIERELVSVGPRWYLVDDKLIKKANICGIK